MKTINKELEINMAADIDIELRAVKCMACSNIRFIEWRVKHDYFYIQPYEEIVGHWPFKKKIQYTYKNDWKRIEITTADGDAGYVQIGGMNTSPQFDMEAFIKLRNRLTTYGHIQEYAASETAANKAKWCETHGVSEFIDIDDVDEDEIIWK